jgi:hypothetical protein
MTENNELELMWKQAVVACFKKFPSHLEVLQKIYQQSVSGKKFPIQDVPTTIKEHRRVI